MELCKCGFGLANTGQEKCPIASVTYGVIGVSIEDSDGNLNKIPAGTTLDAAYINGKLNEADPTKRWFPIQDLRNVTDVRNTSEFETDSAGGIAKLRTGTRPFFGESWKSSPQFLCKLQSWECSEFGLFVIDINNGMVVRSIDDSGDAYPLPVDQNSWDPLFVPAQDGNVQKVTIGFNWHSELNDCELKYIQASNFQLPLKSLRGLFDIEVTYTNANQFGVTADLKTQYGDYFSPIPDTGVLLANVSLYYIDGATPIAIDAWTPDPVVKGRYVITNVALLTNGEYRLVVVNRPGKDYSLVYETPFTVNAS